MRKNHCSIRKNTIRNNHFIQELTPRIPLEMTNSPKNLLLGLKIIIWLCVSFSSDKLLASNNCCKTHHQPNSFTHSLTNLLYWAYWAHILFYLGLGYDLWPYSYINWISETAFFFPSHFWQWDCHNCPKNFFLPPYFGNGIATNQLEDFFFHPISTMPLPQFYSTFFFFKKW